MFISVFTLLESAALSLSCSADAFAASMAYGSGRIKIPFQSAIIIDIAGTAIMAASLFAGQAVRGILPRGVTVGASFGILFLLGLVKLLDSFTKSFIRRHNGVDKQVTFSMCNLQFILRLYANPEDADVDASKVISPSEAASLAVALSLDGIAAGFGAALDGTNAAAVIIMSLTANAAAIALGGRLGNRLANKKAANLSWLSGAVLIALAFARFIF